MSTQILHEPNYSSTVNRSLKAVPLAGLITLALLLCMYTLIKNDYEYVEPPTETPRIADIWMEPTGPIETVFEKPERPEQPSEQPPLPVEDPMFVNPGLDGIQLTRFTPDVPTTGTIDFGGDQLMPLIKVQPNYPATAAARGIEGFVDVVFDVTTIGTTENIRITHAEPSSVFNRSVIQAIQRWKYKPQVVDGNPVKAFDVRERITFEFDD